MLRVKSVESLLRRFFENKRLLVSLLLALNEFQIALVSVHATFPIGSDFEQLSTQSITCSKSTIKTLYKIVKFVPSYQ